jgi:hypothetical protein
VGHPMVHHYKRSQRSRGGIGDPGRLGWTGAGPVPAVASGLGQREVSGLVGCPSMMPVGNPMHRPILDPYRGFDPRAVCSTEST